MQNLCEVPRSRLRAARVSRANFNQPTPRCFVRTKYCSRHASRMHLYANVCNMSGIGRVTPATDLDPLSNASRHRVPGRNGLTGRNVPVASLKMSGHQLRPSEVVKFHVGLVRRSSSFLKSCTLRRVLRIMQTFLDSHSAFDAQRVISRVMYDADVALTSAREAAEKLAAGQGGAGSDATSYPQTAVIRRYTVTHSDETGVLTTSVGSEYDQTQLKSLKQQLFRDRVLGELVYEDSAYALHLYAYVAGKYLLWPCPPAVRSYIFQRDINLVVESIVHADMDFLEAVRVDTAVLLHLESDSHEEMNETVVFAKVLGDKSTWALGASASSKLRLTNFWDRCAAALYSWAVLQKDRNNEACGEACNVSCSLDNRDEQ